IAAVIGIAQARIVKISKVRRCGIYFLAGDVRAFQAEIVKRYIPKETLEAVSIGIVRHAVVAREKIRAVDPLVELRIIQTLLSVAVVKRARQQQLQPISVFISIGHPAFVGVEAASL